MESEEFYAEAENMQIGWGKRLKLEHELYDRANTNQDITLKETCYMLWAQLLWNSDACIKFENSMEYLKDRKMPWPAWKGLFYDWLDKIKN